jgi:hypothetical protein
MLKGKVKASAIGKYKLGFAFVAAILIAAGTAIQEAFAARIENNSSFPSLPVTNRDKYAVILPLINGITIANKTVNHSFLMKAFSF